MIIRAGTGAEQTGQDRMGPVMAAEQQDTGQRRS